MGTSAESALNNTPLAEPLHDTQISVSTLLELIQNSLEDAKAENIISIDLKNKTSIGDTMVIASGRSHRHVGSIAEQLLKNIKKAGLGKAHAEGLSNCDWVLIDTGDVIIHLFRPEVRDFYNLEKIWSAERPDQISSEEDTAKSLENIVKDL